MCTPCGLSEWWCPACDWNTEENDESNTEADGERRNLTLDDYGDIDDDPSFAYCEPIDANPAPKQIGDDLVMSVISDENLVLRKTVGDEKIVPNKIGDESFVPKEVSYENPVLKKTVGDEDIAPNEVGHDNLVPKELSGENLVLKETVGNENIVPNAVGCENLVPLTILVTHDNVTKAVFANYVPSKGTSHAYAERALAANITLLGHKRVKIQSDQEPAILDVKNKARQHALTELMPDESPEGDSDGLTAYQAIRGKTFDVQETVYDEAVVFKPLRG